MHLFCPLPTQESEGPFPWHPTSKGPPSTTSQVAAIPPQQNADDTRIATMVSAMLRQVNEHQCFSPAHAPVPRSQVAPPKTSMLEGLDKVIAESEALGCIHFRTPAAGSLAGRVLRHAVAEMERMFREKGPVIFKVGFTHDPVWRFTNKLYGYCHDCDGWTNMLVLFVSDEPHGPAFLEASLIKKYRCSLSFHNGAQTIMRQLMYKVWNFRWRCSESHEQLRQAWMSECQTWWRWHADGALNLSGQIHDICCVQIVPGSPKAALMTAWRHACLGKRFHCLFGWVPVCVQRGPVRLHRPCNLF